jgi:sugar (pentulose or hexulose) kinase
MNTVPAIVIFDVGKTNKKIFIFSESYQILYRETVTLKETLDEDGDACEDLAALENWVLQSLEAIINRKEFEIKAVNFSTYGASLVYIDVDGNPLTPLYNYLKPYPENLQKQFYDNYGGQKRFSSITASPVLGSLNSGMQLYRIKYERPELFEKIKYALHLPQYLSYLVSKKYYSDITSIGCHTNLWNFEKNEYHSWVTDEGIFAKLPPLAPSHSIVSTLYHNVEFNVGIGLHDSSAALIPYLVNFHDSFILISTGTWCISLNPFNQSVLTDEELEKDCLSYIQYKGQPVKASRLFAGYEHEIQVERIASHFAINTSEFNSIDFNKHVFDLLTSTASTPNEVYEFGKIPFNERDLSSFSNHIEAYHQLMIDLVKAQCYSTKLIMDGSEVKRIFVDGGFSSNSIYMNLLAMFFPDMEVYAASMAQATAVGTALAIHKHWNSEPLQNDIIQLQYYSIAMDTTL